MKHRHYTLLAIMAGLGLAIIAIHTRYRNDLGRAAARAAQGSVLANTRCGPIEYQEAGTGIPLLVIHGSGGGHDQGMDFARPLAQHGIRVIAVSRFGYLRTPRPADASPQAQADAHVCLLDALGIERAAVLGLSAGGPSAMQAAIRYPDRVGALVLVVPLVHKPESAMASAPPVSDEKDEWLLRLVGSDFLYWSALKLAPDQVIRHLLATPPELVPDAGAREREHVKELAEHVLPVSLRAAGLRDDTRLGKSLKPYALEAIRAPTLAISARDDGFGTYANARYAASRIPHARFIGFENGGHLLVGHDDEVLAEIAKLVQGVMAR
ncbi:MAG: alpha/beta hydrolase [Proteobacteria bacterium]|nr:alpha/beta hydrolase [Pseudomonadota bacterium]